ncbi:MAG: NUDIX hydrolase [Gemmatimonadota bacterium]|nr:MAG: NUDIX hydrolase [Gemmatimonadota bacterium]
MERVRILKKERVFKDVFAIDRAVLKFRKHDGSWSPPVRQLCFERGDSVAALLLNRDSGRLVLVNQFRYPTYEKGPGWLTEVVAGGLDEDEMPEDAIVREVYEETGYRVEKLRPVSTFYVSPGGTSERVVLFYGEVDGEAAAGSSFGTGADEDTRVVEIEISELWESFLAGTLQDAKTIIALLWLMLDRAQPSQMPGRREVVPTSE